MPTMLAGRQLGAEMGMNPILETEDGTPPEIVTGVPLPTIITGGSVV